MQKLTADDPTARSADVLTDNIERLRALFPEAFTEGQINFEVLKQLLGGAVDEREEKYGLNWHGKRRARQLALTPSTGTLRPCPAESVDWDSTQNLMIEGDNLEVLKLLQKSYSGKVKMIYIDPPYNTGKDRIYPDRFSDSLRNYLEVTGQADGGATLVSNTEASGRFHTAWLNMLYPRLKLARTLLSPDGAVCISISEHEVHNLRHVCDEIFGPENYLAQFAWRTDGNFDNQAKVKSCHEYILFYALSEADFPHPPVVDPSTPTDSKLFREEIRNTIVKNGPGNPPSAVVLPPGFPADFVEGEVPARSDRWPHYASDAIVSGSRLVESVQVYSGWSSKDLLEAYLANECQPIVDRKGQETRFVVSRTGAIEAIKKRSDSQSHVISVISGLGGAQKASAELEELGVPFADYPKPTSVLQYLVAMHQGKDFLSMDFFAGSGSLGHAIIEQNAVDGGSRKFILVQLPQQLDETDVRHKSSCAFLQSIGKPPTIAELTKERLRRAAKKIHDEHPMFAGDTGFRVFKLDHSNIRPWDPDSKNLAAGLLKSVDHIREGRTEQDVLHELLLKLGLDLRVPKEEREIAGKRVHSVGAGTLLVCLSKSIAPEEADELALGMASWHEEQSPAGETTVVFRDSAFANDVAKTNIAAILQQHGLQNVRSL